jgi:Na+:H+ antiporter, NhaA family
MPLFALANAGVTLGGDVGAALASPVTLGIILGLVLGKPIGITLASWLAVRAGAAAKPEGVRWASLHAVSWLGGIGFTMSLFVANLAFTGAGAGALLDAAKLGILSASLVAGIVGYTIMRRSTAPSEAPEVVANELVPEARDAGAL